MRQAYADVYRDLYQRHWWWRAREAVLLHEIARRTPPAGWGRILDVGCGDALFFDRLMRIGDAWGVESDASLVRDDGPYRNRVHVGRFDTSFVPDRPFRLVLMLDVLEHMQDPVAALTRVREVLEPGGSLLLTVPAFQIAWTHHDDINEHVVRYTRRTLEPVVRAAGLTLASSRYLFHWLFPIKLAVRAWETLRTGEPAPAGVPPQWLNAILRTACVTEERLLGWARLPLGTSLLAWCDAPRRAVEKASREPAAAKAGE